MTKVSFADNRKKAESEGLLAGSKRFKVEEGENRIRLLSECLPHPGEYNGTPTFKWLCYVIDRRDGKIKPFFMPNTIYKDIEKFQRDPEYVFDEVPMPYDVTIHAVGAGTKDVEYTTVAARTNTPLTPAELALFRGTEPIAKLQRKLQEESGARSAGERAPAPHDDDGPNIQTEFPA